MEKIRIKCPLCGIVLETLDNPANYEKTIVCPNCKTKNKFKDFKRVLQKAKPSQEDDKTEIGAMSNDTTGYLLDMITSQEYPLKSGLNLIGRYTLNTPPKATIPIKTSDMGVSREHLYLEVIMGRDGHYHTYAYNAKNKNETMINGVKLEDGDKIGIKHNDIITLSDTQLKYMGNQIEDITIL